MGLGEKSGEGAEYLGGLGPRALEDGAEPASSKTGKRMEAIVKSRGVALGKQAQHCPGSPQWP